MLVLYLVKLAIPRSKCNKFNNKSMIRLKDTRYTDTASFLSSAIAIAEYYGFVPFDEALRAQEKNTARKGSPNKVNTDIAYARKDERALAATARKFSAHVPRSPDALLAWRISTTAGALPAVSFELHVVGSSDTIAEALLLVISHAITREAGIEKHMLAINNIGSSESCGRYTRDVGAFLRKNMESISPSLRPRAATDPIGTLIQLVERGHPSVTRAPQSLEYLSEEERRRFWELLEYLEICGLPYELSPHILGSRDCWAHSLFEVAMTDKESGARVVLASGGRYDPLASRFARMPLPATMVSITCEVRGQTDPARHVLGIPSLYFVHLGHEARRRTLPILESLRRAGIPVHQRLHYERIGEQMNAAQQLGAPFILIMGHKEVMENSVLIREVSTNAQHAVALNELVTYLKRRRMGTLRPVA
jgi:histidyl-tRNA synthetase